MINLKGDPKKRSKTLQAQTKFKVRKISIPNDNVIQQSSEEHYQNYMKYQTPKANSKIYDYFQEKSSLINICDHSEKGNFIRMKKMIRSDLQKLTYKQKLNNIESIIWRCKSLCNMYGYFILTCMMFEYNPSSDIKFSIWIHPDKRVQKPLHPINRPTQFECQLEFISNLRRILGQMFPTIDLGRGKTFSNLFYHITDLKKVLLLKNKKNFGPNNALQKQQDLKLRNRPIAQEQKKNLCTSLKNIPTIFHTFQNIETCDDPNPQVKDFQKKETYKLQKTQKSTSTLVQSIRSNNGLKQKIKKAASNIKQEPQFSQGLPIFGSSSAKIIPLKKFNSRKSSIDLNPIQRFEKIQEKDEDNKIEQKIIRKSQINGRRSRINAKMVTSGQIESDLNNLFGAEDLNGSGYYVGFDRNNRSSLLSQVMEEFEDLLF